MNGPYHMMECFVPPGKTITDIVDYPLIDGVDSWMSGSRFATALSTPIQLAWDPSTNGVKKHLYDATIPLFHRDLIDALHAAGVDNLDCYPVKITDNTTGAVDETYTAVNVIGLVAAADLAKSKHSDPSGRGRIDMDFDGVCLSKEAPQDLMLFRLAECVSALVVHDSVKRFLETRGGFGLTFVAPERWIG